MDKTWSQKGKGPSPTLVLQCQQCQQSKRIQSSVNYSKSNYYNLVVYLLMMAILLTGSTFERTSSLLNILEINIGSKTFYHRTVVPDVETEVNKLLEDFLKWTRSQIKNKDDVFIVIDGGWSHPGWWSRECTVIAVDGNTGLSVYVQHALRDKNFTGSSSRGFAVYYALNFFYRNGSLGSSPNNEGNGEIRIHCHSYIA